ncbi:MAG: sialate O-acetylesterase, partial [Flavobacteriaceae bacterium]|nr:sialate O-acetylesterase [Flavobacteriaceae bacterium]
LICGMKIQEYFGLDNILNSLFSFKENKVYLDKSHEEKLSIFILAGQSNMVGDGNIEEFDKSLNKEGIYVFDENYKWIIGKEPVCSNKVGPSISFASTLIENNNNEPIGIINVAKGGTSIAQWLKNGNDNSLYKEMMKRTLASSTQGEIKGLLFFQGEKDAEGGNTSHIENWHLKFEEFVSDVRQDLKLDSLPVIFAQIGKGDELNWNKVKLSQEKVSIPLVTMIKTDDLDFQPKKIHFTTNGYIEIGRRFALKYIEEFKTTPNK